MVREIGIQQPFDLGLSLTMGQTFRWKLLPDEFYGDDRQWFSGVLGKNLIHIRRTERGVAYRVGGPDGGRKATDEDDLLLRRYFRDDDDVTAIYSDISRDPTIARLVEQYWGMRVLRQEPWECLVSYICSANNSIAGITGNVEAISAELGDFVALNGEARPMFPTPEQLAEGTEDQLRGLKLGFRSPNLVSAAMRVTDAGLDAANLRLAPSSYAKRHLMTYQGIGPKIADCVALMSLDKLEAFPVDTHIRRLVGNLWFSGEAQPSDAKLVQWAQGHFGKYAGYAGQFLFCDRGQTRHRTARPTRREQAGGPGNRYQRAISRTVSRYENREHPCPKCGAAIGKVCVYPSGYRYEKGHSERGLKSKEAT